MNRMAGTQRSPFLGEAGCKPWDLFGFLYGFVGPLEIPPCLSAAVMGSIVSRPVHPGQPRGNPWICSGIAPAPSHGSTTLSSRNSGEDGQKCLPGKQMAVFPVRRTVAAQPKACLCPSRSPGTGFCYFGWRSKYSQLCLFPACGLFCGGKHQGLVSKLLGMGTLPRSATCTRRSPCPGRVQAVGLF